jgi:hypothetical protein
MGMISGPSPGLREIYSLILPQFFYVTKPDRYLVECETAGKFQSVPFLKIPAR